MSGRSFATSSGMPQQTQALGEERWMEVMCRSRSSGRPNSWALLGGQCGHMREGRVRVEVGAGEEGAVHSLGGGLEDEGSRLADSVS